jgi:hypothetical protein
MNIDILTLSMGRDFYLNKNIESIKRNLHDEVDIVQHIVLQGVGSSINFDNYETKNYKIKVHKLEKNIGCGMGNNYIKSFLRDDGFIHKMDDDCEIVSHNYFIKLFYLLKMLPEKFSFSPYPVGLINNPGGVQKRSEHIVAYSKEIDQYYTLRPVHHIGGFARINPVKLFKEYIFPDDLSDKDSGVEDISLSNYCQQHGIPLFYLENALVVEHMESTLGQHKRYGETYFGKRF